MSSTFARLKDYSKVGFGAFLGLAALSSVGAVTKWLPALRATTIFVGLTALSLVAYLAFDLADEVTADPGVDTHRDDGPSTRDVLAGRDDE